MALNLDTLSGASLETPDGIARTIVGLVLILFVGFMVLNGIGNGVSSQMDESVTLTFSEQPADGDAITVGEYVFEFDNNGVFTSGHIPVVIGATVADTIYEFNMAMESMV